MGFSTVGKGMRWPGAVCSATRSLPRHVLALSRGDRSLVELSAPDEGVVSRAGHDVIAVALTALHNRHRDESGGSGIPTHLAGARKPLRKSARW